jgi:dTDP-4-amino-4,6-dideoxygalactose transaminase
MRQIPFNRIHLSGLEQEYMADAIREGHIAGNGRYTQRVEGFLQEVCNSPRVLLTGSCSHALEMCALLLNISAADEVIVPSFTFPSTVGSFVLRGARPVFVDVRPDTLNLDERLIEEKITPRTRAIVVTHYAGVACEMDAIEAIAQRHGVDVVEDNAQGLFGKYRGRPLGSIGALGAVSFHETKNSTCGEGGALIIGANRAELMERAEVLREMGTDRSRFLKGAVDKYTWVDLGSSYLLSEILAAFLAAQLEVREDITRRRRKIWERYWFELSPLTSSAGILLPSVPNYCEQPYHMFYILMPSLSERELLLRELNSQGIHAQSHYEPLHLSKMGASFGYSTGDFPVTESVSSRLLRLPFYPDLSEDEQSQVIEQVMAAQLK